MMEAGGQYHATASLQAGKERQYPFNTVHIQRTWCT